MRGKRSAIYAWTVVALVMGVMVSVQYHDVVLGGTAIWSSLPDVASVGIRVQAVEQVNDSLRAQTQRVLEETYALQRLDLHRGGRLAEIERQLHAAIVLTGLSPLTGPGVVVRIDDGRMSPIDQEQFLTHDWDLRSVVNELFLAGADAVAVNNARVTSQTGIFCIGPVVRVGGIRLGPPFVIRAIGDPSVLAAAMDMPGSVLDVLRADNRGLRVTTPLRLRRVTVAAYSPPLFGGAGGDGP